jgi:hypothetical protein
MLIETSPLRQRAFDAIRNQKNNDNNNNNNPKTRDGTHT